MSAIKSRELVSVEDYLAGELVSPVKHEYLGGFVYAMSGARNLHNVIAGNVFGSLYVRLLDQRCQPFNSDTKIRVRLGTQSRFYYPDVSVVCRPNAADDSFHDEPVIIFEVLSTSTRRTDEGEKKDAYLTIPSLAAYVLLEQEFAAASIVRRVGPTFVRQELLGLDAVLTLPEIGAELPFSEIYRRVAFSPEVIERADP